MNFLKKEVLHVYFHLFLRLTLKIEGKRKRKKKKYRTQWVKEKKIYTL